MAVSTRGATGNSKPRVFAAVSTSPARKRTTAKTTTDAGVIKKRAPVQKKKPTLKDKAEGAAEKLVDTVEGKTGRKGAGTKKVRGVGRPKKAMV